jgi:hypothetical protein
VALVLADIRAGRARELAPKVANIRLSFSDLAHIS